jgi:hypothetical protein
MKICNTLGLHNYIFDYPLESKNFIPYKKINTPDTLYQDFSLFNERKIELFLSSTNIKYISETFKNNKQILNSFSFMVYICFDFYQNYKKSQEQLDEIKDINKIDINPEYSSIIKLSSDRLEYVNNINIVTFKKYSHILDHFFSLLK